MGHTSTGHNIRAIEIAGAPTIMIEVFEDAVDSASDMLNRNGISHKVIEPVAIEPQESQVYPFTLRGRLIHEGEDLLMKRQNAYVRARSTLTAVLEGVKGRVKMLDAKDPISRRDLNEVGPLIVERNRLSGLLEHLDGVIEVANARQDQLKREDAR